MEEGKTFHLTLAASVQVGILSTGTRSFSNELFYSANDNPPSRRDINKLLKLLHSPRVVLIYTIGTKQLCKVNYEINCSKLWREASYRDPNTKEKWRDAAFDLYIRLDSATLHFFVFYKVEAVAYTEVQYREDC